MPLQDKKWKQDQTIIKVLGFGETRKIKIIHCGYLRTAGIENDSEHRPQKGSVNESKLENNISRAKSKVYELAYCNPWEYFFTATLDGEKHVRSDLEAFHKNLVLFLRDCKRRYGLECPIKFLLIPEKHLDGINWHMHGFLMGLPVEHLRQFRDGDKMPYKLSEKISRGDVVYNWLDYEKSFGWNTVEPVRNHEAVSKYITKYINKAMSTAVSEINAHLYYRSRGLSEALTIKKGTMLADIVPDFTHEYGWVKEVPYSDEVLNWLIEQFV